jgi:hypothetical protein
VRKANFCAVFFFHRKNIFSTVRKLKENILEIMAAESIIYESIHQNFIIMVSVEV